MTLPEWICEWLVWLTALQLGIVLFMCGRLVLGLGRIDRLRDEPIPADMNCPSVSIVLAAQNEEAEIRNCIENLLAQDYPGLEIIAVNDRSNDSTEIILNELAAADPRLEVIHVTELPDSWLGKNHAIQLGAIKSRGDYILFTDGDVIMRPDTLRRAMANLAKNNVDHLTVIPSTTLPSWLLESVTGILTKMVMLKIEPWKPNVNRLEKHFGVGAFNLVSRQAYHSVGMHEKIRMCPLDDVKLAKILKAAGFRQRIALGIGLISVNWYHSMWDMIRGLEKNTLAMFDYRLSRIAGFMIFLVAVWGSPFPGLLVVAGAARWLLAGTVIVILATMWWLHRCLEFRGGAVLLYPIGILVILFMILRNTWLPLSRGGIQWRNTFYSLEQIRSLDC